MKKYLQRALIPVLCALVSVLFASCSLFEPVPINNSEELTAKEYFDEGDLKKGMIDFGASSDIEEPQTGVASNSAAATKYEPVYPLSISNEPVRNPVSLHSSVPESLRKVYSVILSGLEEGKNEIVFKKPIDVDDMRRAIIYVRDFNPDLFYIDWSAYNYNEGPKGISAIRFDFLCEDIATYKDALENVINTVVTKANTLPNLFERELYVHDYLVNNVIYSVSEDFGGSAYGALVSGYARCEGYAKAFQIIMLRIGIPCYTSVGSVENERHLWNTVNLYGKYYNVDVTFDDNSGENYKTAHSENQISHSCFNISDEILGATHTVDQIGSLDRFGSYQNLFLPECDSLGYSYYTVRGLVITNLEQFKYLLSKHSPSRQLEVFFDGEMPTSEQFRAEFDRFYRESDNYDGYSIYYSPDGSELCLRHVFRISW